MQEALVGNEGLMAGPNCRPESAGGDDIVNGTAEQSRIVETGARSVEALGGNRTTEENSEF